MQWPGKDECIPAYLKGPTRVPVDGRWLVGDINLVLHITPLALSRAPHCLIIMQVLFFYCNSSPFSRSRTFSVLFCVPAPPLADVVLLLVVVRLPHHRRGV